MVPKFWLLSQQRRSRIFQQKNVPDILKEVLTGFDTKVILNGTYEPRNYCVQYRETDMDFATRLMEEEGIFYYFEHASGKHTLVLGDDSHSNPTCPGLESTAATMIGHRCFE